MVLRRNDSDYENNDQVDSLPHQFEHMNVRPRRHSLDLPGIVQAKLDGGEHVGTNLVVVMVGLPARGKSYIVKKLKRYLTWLHYETKIFNVGDLRRHAAQMSNNDQTTHKAPFFDPDNKDAKKLRDHLAMESLDELIDWLRKGGRVGIHDATNSTVVRRQMILDRCQQAGMHKVLFIESICHDRKMIEANMRLKLSGPDYKNVHPDEALEDFRMRVSNYEKAYETISEEEERKNIQYCKLINVGKKVIAHNIQGYLSGQCVIYLMNFNLEERQIWLTRHGECVDVSGRLGDASLSARGRRFGTCLARFMHKQKCELRHRQLEKYHADVAESSAKSLPEPPEKNFTVWTSLLKRTIETVEGFDPREFKIMHIRFLNEIYDGLCEDMAYQFSEEYGAWRKNKRSPDINDELYLDIIHRVNPLIVELERMSDNILIITHQVVLEILLAYFLDVEKEKVSVPLHTVYCLEPMPYGTKLTLWRYDEEKDWFFASE